MTKLDLSNATPKEIETFAKDYRLTLNEKTVLLALQSVSMFLNEKNYYYVIRNLEDALSYASPRLRSMKTSIREHLPFVQKFTIDQQYSWLEQHFEKFCKGVKAS